MADLIRVNMRLISGQLIALTGRTVAANQIVIISKQFYCGYRIEFRVLFMYDAVGRFY